MKKIGGFLGLVFATALVWGIYVGYMTVAHYVLLWINGVEWLATVLDYLDLGITGFLAGVVIFYGMAFAVVFSEKICRSRKPRIRYFLLGMGLLALVLWIGWRLLPSYKEIYAECKAINSIYKPFRQVIKSLVDAFNRLSATKFEFRVWWSSLMCLVGLISTFASEAD